MNSRAPFDTPITEADGVLFGPPRTPQQMLAVQEYDGHALYGRPDRPL
jgi:hypothetical protein